MLFSRQAQSNYRIRRIEAIKQLKALQLPSADEVDGMKAAELRDAVKQLVLAVDALRVVVSD